MSRLSPVQAGTLSYVLLISVDIVHCEIFRVKAGFSNKGVLSQ